ncbi:MAG: AMP-binding protein [Lysobacter sp.]|nr:AMP-binding protein [Lysobacter sp.]
MSIVQFLERGRRLSKDGLLATDDHRSMGYGEFIDLVAQVASRLRSAGIGRGARVGVAAPNLIDALAVPYGALTAGATYLPVAATGTHFETEKTLRKFECTALIYHPKFEPVVEALRQQLPAMRFIPLAELVEPRPDDARQEVALPGSAPLDEIAWLIATGGTTGEPKGVELSWRAIIAYVQKFLAEVPLADETMLLATPLTHAAGMLALPVIASGGRLVIANGVEPARFISAIEQHRVTATFLPPTAIYKLLDHPGVETRDFSSLRHFIYGAAPVALPRLREALRVFGPVMTQCYGQSECHTFIAMMRPCDHFVDGRLGGEIADDGRLSACGRPNLGNIVEIRKEDGGPAAAGEPGEICVASDLNMSGYFRDEEQTRATLVEGFILTGDVGFLDDDGFLHIADRKKDMIITGGFNVYPTEVENVMHDHPAVAECAVVGVPDPYWGEAVVAVIRAHDGRNIDVEALRGQVQAQLGAVKTPKAIHIWDELPKSAVGKILKRDIRDRLVRESESFP